MNEKSNKRKKIRKILGRIFLGLLLFFVLVILAIRTPWMQNFLVSKMTTYISEKTNTVVQIENVYITFSGDILVKGLYLEDKKGDTLLYSKVVQANIPIYPIAFKNQLSIADFQSKGLVAHIQRYENPEEFNFTFLIDALAPKTDTLSTPSSAPMEINLGDISLEDWNVVYDDTYMGIESQLKLGILETSITSFDLNKMQFSIGDFLLNKTRFNYQQSKPFPKTNDTTTTVPPQFLIADFVANDVVISYGSIPDRNKTMVNLGQFSMTDLEVITNKNSYTTNTIKLYNSTISLEVEGIESPTKDASTIASPFIWPNFDIRANGIDLSNNQITYSSNHAKPSDRVFNPNAFSFQKLNLQASDISYQPKKFNLAVSNFSFIETSGIHLKKLVFQSKLSDKNASLSNFLVQLNQSSANGNLTLSYDTLEGLLNNPKNSSLIANLDHFHMDPNDIKNFIPEYRTNTYLAALATKSLDGSVQGKGSLAKIDPIEAQIKWGNTTSITASGFLENLTQKDSLRYNFNRLHFTTVKEDLQNFVSESEIGMVIPKTIEITTSIKGTPEKIAIDGLLQIPEGKISLDASLDFKNAIAFKGVATIDSLQLGQLLKNEQLGMLSFKVQASGSGKKVSDLNAHISTDFSQLNLFDYNYQGVTLEGDIKEGKGTIALNSNDTNLNMKAEATIRLDTGSSTIEMNSTIIGADLQALRLTKNNIKIGTKINGYFKGNATDYTAKMDITNSIAVINNEQFQAEPISLTAKVNTTNTDVAITSGFMNGNLKSNASPDKISAALKTQFENYFNTTAVRVYPTDSIAADLNFSIKPTPIITKVFFTGLEELDSISIVSHFNSIHKSIYTSIYIPKISYARSAIDSLNVVVAGDSVNLKFSAGIADLTYNPLHLKKTYLKGDLKNKELVLDFMSIDESAQLVHVASELIFQKDTLKLHINPENLIFNKKEWHLPSDNKIIIADNFLDFQNINLNRNQQSLKITNAMPNVASDHLGIVFENFELQTFLSFLNPDQSLASGKVQGDFIIENPFADSGLVAKLQIDQFNVWENPLGTMTLDASSKSFSTYDFDLALKGGDADLELIGDYVPTNNTAKLDMLLAIKSLKTSVVTGFLKEDLSEPKGYFSGKIALGGTLEKPLYAGELDFNEVAFTVNAYKTSLAINNERIAISEEGIYFNNFDVKDKTKGTLVLDGNMGTNDLLKPTFDLSLKAEQFRILDAKEEDNELIYGIASINADITIKGDLDLPKVDGTARIRDITNITYVVPASQLDIQERDGVVIFVNKENPDAILTRTESEQAASLFAGLDADIVLEISDDATFTIILDKKTQDMLQASGEATLNLNIDPNQDIRLSGRLNLVSGFYRTSLYNLVSRRFDIKKGSSILWAGDPYDAKLDVTAIYEIETTAAPLMAAIAYDQDATITGQYQRATPFLVYLNVEGELTQPELSFALDMPENAQGSFGGAVYGRIQQLNQQESELNKQVFSLLALNRFYPTTGSDGSSGGTVALARNNVNKVLSGELNALSNKLLGNSGFEVGFDLDSFQEYQGDSYQDRTQLNINASKKLFDDRLIVTAGSALDVEGSAQAGESSTPIIGNVTLEYLLSQEGTYRLKGFRRQEYQNVIDGQLIVTGIAFIFDREFNKFSQLFSPISKGSEEKSKEDKTSSKKEKD